MNTYQLHPYPELPTLLAPNAKEKRRQVLAKAATTRKANYVRFLEQQRVRNQDVGEGGI
jgi:hypothetical protein